MKYKIETTETVGEEERGVREEEESDVSGVLRAAAGDMQHL